MGRPYGVTGLCCLGLLLLASPAMALMSGSAINAAPVVQLVFEHRAWHEYRQEWRVSHSDCSAVVVGRTPMTLLTAAHCLRDVSLDEQAGLPMLSISHAASPLLQAARLKQAIFPEFDKVRGNLIDDLAVLVFDQDLPDQVAIAPVLLDEPASVLLICGYGYGSADALPVSLRCANKAVHQATEGFAAFLPSAYASLDPVFYARYQVQFESKVSVVSALDTLVAVNRLTDQGAYDPALPMPTLGDSGGPWLEALTEGHYGVVGITSFVESFYGSSPQLPFFRQSSAPMADFVYAAYGIRLDSMRARKLFNAARIKGADIRVYRRNWQYTNTQ
ncbi:trypsin-like serine protease [Methylobacillus methanolivorans]|uniref:Trypsin-like serine protease n=1 Tax=Methylobacillus methanolivorans TaxID=1848927 RepID=A0ABW8GKY0_9PROT